MQWLQITVNTTSDGSDLISMLMLELGSEGTSVVDRKDIEDVLNDKNSWDYVDDELLKGCDDIVSVSGFFGVDFDLTRLKYELDKLRNTLGESVGPLEIEVKDIRDADWANEWRKYYEPIERENVAIVPEWLDYRGNCPVRVHIEPGMAFGTGRHETTAMCVSLMQKTDVKGKTVLDIGCGSGILGITALKLGAKRCIMSDIDAAAVDSARENAKLNDVITRSEFVCGDLKIGDKCDIVLANLTADILLKLYEILPETVNRGGYAVISGLIHARADEVLSVYSNCFELIERLSEGEWQAMLLRKI